MSSAADRKFERLESRQARWCPFPTKHNTRSEAHQSMKGADEVGIYVVPRGRFLEQHTRHWCLPVLGQWVVGSNGYFGQGTVGRHCFCMPLLPNSCLLAHGREREGKPRKHSHWGSPSPFTLTVWCTQVRRRSAHNAIVITAVVVNNQNRSNQCGVSMRRLSMWACVSVGGTATSLSQQQANVLKKHKRAKLTAILTRWHVRSKPVL